ncbi:MAG: hypothetical protein L0I76_37530 [Pseudonocardia sp.]|nr:hypothetical protein [Pseudonocardia sp.]
MSADLQSGNPAGTATSPDRDRRRAVLVLGGIAALIIVLLVGLVAFLLGVGTDDPGPGAGAPPARPPATVPLDEGGWDVAAQTELATRPMLQLPESAALPHPLTTETAGPPIELPEPGNTAGQLVAGGFPGTPEGAVAQLIELTRVGLEGGDPEGYRLAYESVAAPGAPAVESTRIYRDLQQIRAGTGLPPSGAVAGLMFSWSPTSALIKGTTDDGRYVVACVLGELVTGLNGQAVSTGAGSCQALRRVDDQWRISPGAAASAASLAWPGTAEAVQAGYRDLIR